MFNVKDKIALITGGASGIGLQCAKELLHHGLRGVTLADINSEFGQKAIIEITKEFGPNKAIYVWTDVSNRQSFEDAFKKTVETYKSIDILINNAGVLNDATWEKEIDINLKGTIHGMLLGLENYMPKYKSSDEGIIINISSVAGIEEFPMAPIYSATKFGVVGLTKSWGSETHYTRTKIKVLALCPNGTLTPLFTDISGRNLGPDYEKLLQGVISNLVPLKPKDVATALVKIMNAKSGTIWVIANGMDPYEYVSPPKESFYPK